MSGRGSCHSNWRRIHLAENPLGGLLGCTGRGGVALGFRDDMEVGFGGERLPEGFCGDAAGELDGFVGIDALVAVTDDEPDRSSGEFFGVPDEGQLFDDGEFFAVFEFGE